MENNTVKSFSPSCDRNKQPILEQLTVHFRGCKQVFEIGSGTGQHAVFFAKNLPHLTWHTSDMPDYHGSIQAWLADEKLSNLLAPIAFHFGKNDWPDGGFDGVFTANTTHIMQRDEAKLMMETVASKLQADGVFCQYGPMNVNGKYTSESNRAFDLQLQQNGYGGIRDLEELEKWSSGMVLAETVLMPSNNFLLVWKVV